MSQVTASAETPKPKFKFYSLRDVLNFRDPEWLIEDMIPEGGFIVLYGPPSSGKTFLVLSMGFAVASGKRWLGKAVKQGSVLYIAAEAGFSLKQRVQVLRKAEGYSDDLPCHFMTEPIEIMNLKKAEDGKAFIAALVKACGKPNLIIVDTLARCFSGDENSAQHMGWFIDGIWMLQKHTGATVIIVHHTGKDDSFGARGSSALKGAVDTMVECKKRGDLIKIRCTKQKEAESFPEFHVKLTTVPLDDGRGSCVIKEYDRSGDRDDVSGDSKSEEMLGILWDKAPIKGATATEWQKACEAEGITRESFYRRLRALLASNCITKDGEGQGARYRIATG